MTSHDLPTHGGDIERIAREHGIAPEDLIDFSANINPAGAPEAALRRLRRDATDIRLLMRYPDADSGELRQAISRYAGVDERSIVIANGAAALIDAVVRAVMRLASDGAHATKGLHGLRCVVPLPAFSEYARAVHAGGGTLLPLPLNPADGFRIDVDQLCDTLTCERASLLIITNPHNPSGALVPPNALCKIIDHARHTGTTVLLDEAFIDYVPHASMTPRVADYDNLITLRSLTKFFAMPALRVGYALTSSIKLMDAMGQQIPSWSVTTLAAGAAAAALGDEAYARQSIIDNDCRRAHLSESLAALGWRVHGSAANFLLVETPGALSISELRLRLIREHRIVVRDCSSYEGLPRDRFMRVAVRDDTDNIKLIAGLNAASARVV